MIEDIRKIHPWANPEVMKSMVDCAIDYDLEPADLVRDLLTFCVAARLALPARDGCTVDDLKHEGAAVAAEVLAIASVMISAVSEAGAGQGNGESNFRKH